MTHIACTAIVCVSLRLHVCARVCVYINTLTQLAFSILSKQEIMDSFEFNGGNLDIVHGNSNLDSVCEEATSEKCFDEENEFINEELNGDFKSTLSPKKNYLSPGKKKLRKLKTESTTAENVHKTFILMSPKSSKRKTSNDVEISSDDTEEFNGFDLKDLEMFEPGNVILKKLIAEVETSNYLMPKRRKIILPSWKNVKNADYLIDEMDDNTTDSEDQKVIAESDIYNITADESSLKSEKSANSSLSICSNRSRKGRLSRGASPGNAIRQKVTVDITNPAYREPFKYGWKRELVYRAGASENQVRRMADIYYYTPEGKKVRSYREVVEFLTTSDLTIDNFTFFKEPLGINDPLKEIIRDAKKAKDSFGNKSAKKLSKKAVELLSSKKLPIKKGVDKSLSGSITFKTSPKTVKVPATFKVKLPPKRDILKKDAKSPPIMTVDNEVLSPPLWSSPNTRKQQPLTEKSPIIKTKKLTKKKQALPDTDHRQYFMVSVCAGYHALSRIFQYLKVQELLRAARVCRMWRDLAAHPSLWKTVRMKNSQVTDWNGLAETLKSRGTQHLDLRKMLIVGEADNIWKKFIAVIPRITTLMKLEMCRCPAEVVEEVMKNCSQLKVLNAMSIKCDSLNLESASSLYNCNELRLKAINGMAIEGDLTPLLQISNITHLSLTSVKDLGKKKIEILKSLGSLKTLELGECSDFPEKFGTAVLSNLHNLERLRLEKGQGSCCTFDILEGIAKLGNLTQLELVNFDVKNGFDKYLADCKNIKRLLIIPTYVSQSATSNNMILGGVTELSNSLTHFVWGVTQELLRVTELFVDQCNQMSKQITGDSIPVLKPVPCLNLIDDVADNKTHNQKDDKQPNLSNPQVEILPLPHLQKLLLTALPKTRVKILKIPFHATWRQSISDSASQ